MEKMESAIYCPACGRLVVVVMESLDRKEQNVMAAGITSMLDEAFGISGTTHFEGEGTCGCGKNIVATLHITAFDREEA
jgi:hypothetical protein